MRRFQIVPATLDHAADVAERMRDADRAEVYAASGVTPLRSLEYSVGRSEVSYAVEFDGRAEIMFGVGAINILAGIGAPWLLGTDMVEREFRQFLRGSLWWRGQMLKRYPILRNMVDDRNTVSKRWLRWLGFRLTDPVRMGFENRPFRLFELRATDV